MAAILDAKLGQVTGDLGSARRNARVPGRDREGSDKGSDKGFGQGFGKEGKDLASSRRICGLEFSTPSPVGRRIASRIPPSRFIWVVRLVSCWVVCLLRLCVCVCSFARLFVRSLVRSFVRSFVVRLARRSSGSVDPSRPKIFLGASRPKKF